jgi:hypothetical protein
MKKRAKSKKGYLFIENVLEPARVDSPSFAKVYPEAARQWLYEKNCGFGPDDFSFGSTVRAWFKCPSAKDHIFQIELARMGKAFRNETWSQGCGFCRGLKPSVTNNVADLYPELANEWMRRKNGIGPEEVSFGSGFRAWWKCKKGHIWQAVVVNRTVNDAGCYICNVGAPTDLRDYPDVLMEFDHQKNKGIDPYALPVGKKVAWRCSADPTHEGWVSGFYRTTKQERCPSCTNKKGSKGNNLKVTHPEFAKQWDKEKNGDLKPEMVTENSGRRVFWKCKEGPDHEWIAKIGDRTRDMTLCPFCMFRKTSVTNVLTTLAPKVAREWHPTKNGKARPDQERARSRTLRWWVCSSCSHEWTAEPHRRYVRDSGCPKCATEKQIKNMLRARGIKKPKVNMSAY